MDTNNSSALSVLRHLHEIVEAGERGYAVAAASVKNRALKVLFKSYAQQRAKYKEEIWNEMQRLGATIKPRGSILGAIHRGRITIFAAMTIGEENVEQVVLKEVVLGERVAKLTYERTLRQNLPDQARAVVQRQYEEVSLLLDKVQLMRGKNGRRLVVRLYDTEENADKAVRKLRESGYPAESIEKLSLNPIELYTGRGTNILETILSGAIGGSIWGIVSGFLAALSIMQAPKIGVTELAGLEPLLVVIVLGLIAGGLFVGGSIGFFIGFGTRDEDAYRYYESIEHGRVLVQVMTDESRATQAGQLLAQINIESRAHA